MTTLARWLDIALQVVTLGLLILLALLVVVGVAFRYSGQSFIWYDEVASLLLAWITFAGAGLAALRNAHLSFNGLLLAMPLPWRRMLFLLVDAIFLATFAIIAWAGYGILEIFGSETLVSVPFLTRAAAQSILPVSAVLIILARLLTLPRRYREMIAGLDPEDTEIAQEISRAADELAASRQSAPR